MSKDQSTFQNSTQYPKSMEEALTVNSYDSKIGDNGKVNLVGTDHPNIGEEIFNKHFINY